jgi:hypothetical protein
MPNDRLDIALGDGQSSRQPWSATAGRQTDAPDLNAGTQP